MGRKKKSLKKHLQKKRKKKLKNKNIISCLDLYLSELNNNKRDQYNLIEDLDKTTVIKVDKDKEYIVYPLNK